MQLPYMQQVGEFDSPARYMTERTYRLYQDKNSAPSIVTRRNPATGEEWQELVEAWAIYDRTKNVRRESGHFFVVRKRLDGKLIKE